MIVINQKTDKKTIEMTDSILIGKTYRYAPNGLTGIQGALRLRSGTFSRKILI